MTSILLTGAGPTFSGGVAPPSSGGVASPSYDTDAQNYITAVEAADTQSLETGVKDAINAFVVGCKADGIWTAIKASCILAGARTVTGALVPLVGPAPTNAGDPNFNSNDYSRTAGLKSNQYLVPEFDFYSYAKYLRTNRDAINDPLNNMHRSVYVTADRAQGVNLTYMEAVNTGNANKIDGIFGRSTGGFSAKVNSRTIDGLGTGTTVPSLIGVSRASSANYSWRGLGQSGTQARASEATYVDDGDIVSTDLARGPISVFASRSASSPSYVPSANGENFTPSRLAFYSIGESLDLALLDSRVTTLITSIGAALA